VRSERHGGQVRPSRQSTQLQQQGVPGKIGKLELTDEYGRALALCCARGFCSRRRFFYAGAFTREERCQDVQAVRISIDEQKLQVG
jgi:hypothetical protein